ncbi:MULTISPECIES: hypothetical protein [unclassified Coleofasciculus]|uniref:hypothetical protein n=1 Tax=unclassified Coleofasciculus TaxID=2692782 RepID=UPI001880894C|nr:MULTISPECIES: hypothetical protein [unclassified Coleofasciculus]MBE9128080.1 hypothetical protein [Coleofasciculus sp. LEGE 07081]MBE9146953.1 hypothetical protein [Coleofasciculus sp. LEGE 07092]
MSAEVVVVQTNIEELVAQILMYRRVTRTEQFILKYTLLYKEELNEQEKTLIDRIFYGVRHGLLKLVE